MDGLKKKRGGEKPGCSVEGMVKNQLEITEMEKA